MILVFLTTMSLSTGCEARQPTKIGETPPKTTLPDLAGHTHTIPDDFRGKVVLIQFWSISCPLCVGELTVLESLHERHQSQGLVILAINVSQAKEKVAEFVETRHLSYPVLLDPDALTAKSYGVLALPATILLDRRGVVRGKLFGESGQEALDQLVAPQLTEPAARHP